MTEIIVKKGTDLTADEIAELEHVYRLTNSKMPDNYIQSYHIEKTDPVFHLFKLNGKTVAFQAYSMFRRDTPFAKKAIPVVYLNLSYKDASADKHVKNFAKKSNLKYINDTFGKYWYLKRFAMVFQTYNPNLVERISPNFGQAHPHPTEAVPSSVHHFAKDFFTNQLQLPNTPLSNKLVKEELYTEPSTITTDWPHAYRSKNEARNRFFIDNEVILEQKGEYLLSGKAVFFIGYYSFGSVLKKMVKAKFN